MTGLWLLAITAFALLAPALAPYEPRRLFREYPSAPPMRPHVVREGRLSAPYVHRLVLVDRLEGRYERHRDEVLPLPWAGNLSTPVFLLGADTLGRDVLSGTLHGARYSAGLALLATAGSVLLGAAIGVWAGSSSSRLDGLLMWVADAVLVLPLVYVLLTLRSMLPEKLPPSDTLLLMCGIFIAVGWPTVARGARAIVRAERTRDYVSAAISLGASPRAVIARHLFPACTGFLLTQAALLLPAFVLAEATLSYVGFGFDKNEVATWGTMLADAGSVSAMTRVPWTLAPAAAIFVLTLGSNLAIRSQRRAQTSLLK